MSDGVPRGKETGPAQRGLPWASAMADEGSSESHQQIIA